jgi:endonuclease G, mitochondrial
MLRCLAVIALLLSPVAARAEPAASCTPLFAGGQAPRLLNSKLGQRTHPLCYRAYAVLESGVTRGALWSVEHLTAAGIEGARGTPRLNLFHPDDHLPAADRAELEDYARSGYDRGHMTPSGDMPDAEAQEQSFSLANMVPQTAALNRGIWERIESAVRGLARRRGEAYVVTGPAFQGTDIQQIGNGVLVPSSTWKAVYIPATGDAGAYVCTNTSEPTCQMVTLTALAAQVGVDPFPGLPDNVKSAIGRLPTPRSPRQHLKAQ